MTGRRRGARITWWLLETLLPEESREAVIGDLAERFEQDSASRPVRARMHLWREAMAALFSLQFAPEAATSFTPFTRESHVQSFLADLRHAARVLARARGFTLLCVTTLGLAIGAATVIFSVANPMLLRSLPYPHPERIVTVYERDADGSPTFTGYATFNDIRRGTRALEYTAAVSEWQPTLTGDHDAERLSGQRVTSDYFRVLGVRPALGRDFEAADDVPDVSPVVILSHGLWVRRFGGDPAVIGTLVDFSGTKRAVIGVMPASFDNVMFPTAQAWRPLAYGETQPWACRTCRHLQMVGRIRAGVTRAQAVSDVEALAVRAAREHPREYPAPGAVVIDLQERVTRNARPILLAIVAAVGLLLLIATANVVNLQLARAMRRQEEFAVRSALGAGRGRLAQQLLAEGLLLAALAALAGIVVATVALPSIVAQLPESLPRLAAIRIDWEVLAVVAAIALVAGVSAGFAPAVQVSGRHLFDVLRGTSRTASGARHRTRLALVVGEVAVALTLVLGASLLGRSLLRLLSVDAGFDPSRLVTMEIQATGAAYQQAGAVLANHDRVLEAVRRIPGVTSAALATQLPMNGNTDRYGVIARDKPLENPELAPYGDRYTVTADFLKTMGIPVLRGRTFTEAEARDSAMHVALVSEALAKRIWPGEDALGKQIQLGGRERPWWTVIGVAGNVRHEGLDASVTQQVYMPERQWFWEENGVTLVVRTAGDVRQLVGPVREAVRGVDPLQPIARIASMEQIISRSLAQRRLGLVLFAAFATMALLLAAAGIYGVLAGSVTERTREFGIRAALGASRASIVRLVLRQGVALSVAGLAIGVVVAMLLSRYVRSLLFGVEATDPVALVGGVATILGVAIVACAVPALRAVRVDPVVAMKS